MARLTGHGTIQHCEVHAPATRSTPVWHTDNIDIIIYGHGDGRMFSENACPAIGHVDGVVRDGKSGHVDGVVMDGNCNC